MRRRTARILLTVIIIAAITQLYFGRSLKSFFVKGTASVNEIESSGNSISDTSLASMPFSAEELLYYIQGEISKTDVDVSRRLPDFIRTKIAAPETNRAVKEWPKRDYSQFGQSVYINKLLRNKTNGFFIECGAYDGIQLSNTLYFECERNWTGLLIEGDPSVSLALLRSERRAYMMPHCLSPVNKPFRTNYKSSGVFSSIKDVEQKTNDRRSRSLGSLVTCYPFNAVMEAIGVKHVDFFSLDVEGSELEVLKTIDFHRTRIDVLLIEYVSYPEPTEKSLAKLKEYRKLLNTTGLYKEIPMQYSRPRMKLDALFVRIDLL